MTNNLKKRILILAANPQQTSQLRLSKEVQEIDKALRHAHKRDQFELVQRLAVTPREMRLAVLQEKPQIVHFCGHGLGEGGLVLENEAAQIQLVSTEALAGLFRLFSDKVECILLNACYTSVQAKEIVKHIDYVIGMNRAIGDTTAIEFATSFYDALGAGEDYELAFDYAKNGILFEGINQAHIPVLKKKNNGKASIWIHGWAKQNYGKSPSLELDWTKYFDISTRRIPDQATWDKILLPQLLQEREELTQENSELTLDFRGKLPLTAGIAIGTAFPETRGYTLQVEQRTPGQVKLWRSDTNPSKAKFKIVKDAGRIGEHAVVALGITGNALDDLEQLLRNSSIPFSAAIYAEPESGTGETAITSDADANALAIHAKEIIRQCRQKYKSTRIHLVLFAPLGFCLFLGQRLRAVGDITCYERTADKNYEPSIQLCTDIN